MKNENTVKYPNSANLFRFCRRVLDHKYGGIRVIDQDVGQILGFDPADCSHWKKGKKNIRSIQAVKNIADHLGVDEKLVVDVASGDMDENEAYHEFSGYGAFRVDPKLFETAKKEYYRKNIGTWSKDREKDFKNQFQTDYQKIDQIVTEIHQKMDFKEAPLFLPELVAHYPDITLKPFLEQETPQNSNNVVEATLSGDKLTVKFEQDTENKPYMRYRIAKAMTQYFIPPKLAPTESMESYIQHMQDVESNIFACKLLTPKELIKKELQQIDSAKDIVTQLAETFWVSKTFINKRLQEMLLEENE